MTAALRSPKTVKQEFCLCRESALPRVSIINIYYADKSSKNSYRPDAFLDALIIICLQAARKSASSIGWQPPHRDPAYKIQANNGFPALKEKYLNTF
jgi:hypothetical protein